MPHNGKGNITSIFHSKVNESRRARHLASVREFRVMAEASEGEVGWQSFGRDPG